jgi:hypothetical protein
LGEISRKRSRTVSTCGLESSNSFIQNAIRVCLYFCFRRFWVLTKNDPLAKERK